MHGGSDGVIVDGGETASKDGVFGKREG